MTDDVKAAMERVRRVRNGESLASIYPGQYGAMDYHAERDRLVIAFLALHDENERQRAAYLAYKNSPDFPNWGDVRIRNVSIEGPTELREAAERLLWQGECVGGSGTPYGKHTGYAEQFDQIAVASALLSALNINAEGR